jgi:nicotinate-nucleotide--dimethylbenzimidazole phosphoribosyltransferase
MTASPFDDILILISDLPAAGEAWLEPDPALGRLGDIAVWLSRWQGTAKPRINRPIVALYAGAQAGGDPGATRARLELVAAGGAVINAIAQAGGAGLEAFDLAVDRAVGDFAQGPAMSERECAATMAFGMEALAKQPDLLILGAIDGGAQASAAAIALALFGGAASDWTDTEADAIGRAVARLHAEVGAQAPPLEILRQLGGRETAAIAGAILAARSQGVPVLLDGYAVTAAAAALAAVDPRTVEHVMAGHVSSEPGHRLLLQRLGLEPLLDLGLSAGEGTGGAAALALVKLACDVV